MVSFLDYEGTDPASEAREAADGLSRAKEAFASHGLRRFVFNASSPEEFDARIDLDEIRDQLKNIAAANGADAEEIISSLKNEFTAYRLGNKYIKHRGDKWVIIQKGTGKVLSEHDSEAKAEAAFRAMEMHKHQGAKDPCDDCPKGTKCVCDHDGCHCA